MSKFTPGPWAYAEGVNFGHKCFQIHQADGAPYTPHYSDVAMTERGENPEVQRANAALIAQAPAMYEALQFACNVCKVTSDFCESCEVCQIGAALRAVDGGE
jgi:hypothetical protein